MAALRAFCAYSQTGNLTQAGAALNVSHAAISQQLRVLEDHLDTALLDRSGRSLQLTEAGQHLAKAVDLGFGAIEAAVRDLKNEDDARPLSVTLTSSFAAAWLMPRLPDFSARNPDISLSLNPSAAVVPLEPGGVDVAIRFGAGHWPGLEAEPLVISNLVVVGAPKLIGDRPIETAEHLTRFPWLNEAGFTEAENYLKSQGVESAIISNQMFMPGNLILSAVLDGQGLAVLVRAIAQPFIDEGRLVVVQENDGQRGYHIVTRSGPLRPAAKAFVTWLRRHRDGAALTKS
jgi:LysR family glycine cleavage system transcriptional activator